MKVYISADIEGIAGITHWDEAKKSHGDYGEFREEMTQEVVAACEGAIAAGADDIWIKDAHASGRNIIAARLPECARLIRGWSGHPLLMIQEMDKSFAAAMFIGYHSRAGADSNPLAHTISLKVGQMTLNGTPMSEFALHSYAAALHDVPVIFLSGDQRLCEDAMAFNPGIKTLAVSRGVGPSTISMAPARAQRLIREGAAAALKGDPAVCRVPLPKRFALEIRYTGPTFAYEASWYPGARQIDPVTVGFESTDYFEVLRALKFLL